MEATADRTAGQSQPAVQAGSRFLVDLRRPPWLPPEQLGAGLLGGKGANLLRLAQAGFPIPRTYCLTTAAYRLVEEQLLQDPAARVTSARQLAVRLATAEIPGELGRALAEAYADLKTSRGLPRLAVRSSATVEDSAEASHAGQAASFLNVAGFEPLLQGVRGCWSSLWSDAHLAYRHRPNRPQNGLVLMEAPAMAVLLQEMVPARVAGVLFTVNPVNGNPDELVISAAWGLGETVVGGGAADTYVLDRRGTVLRSDLAAKGSLIEQHPDGGTQVRALSGQDATRPCLTDGLLRRLAGLGRAVEERLEGPVDIEWAEVEGQLILLQARPITTALARPADRADRTASPTTQPVVWSNVNVGEALPGVATPMTWSIIGAFNRRGFEQAFGALGLTVPEHYALVGNIRGRIYLNLSEFMSIASGIPLLTPEVLAQLAGAVDPQIMQGAYTIGSRAEFLRRLPGSGWRVLKSQLIGPAQARKHAEQFRQERDRFYRTELQSRPWEELHPLLRRLVAQFNTTGELLLACSSNALASYVALHLLLQLGGPRVSRLEGELFTGLDGLSSAQPGLRLLELARLARELGLAPLFRAAHLEGLTALPLDAPAPAPDAPPPAALPVLGLFGLELAGAGLASGRRRGDGAQQLLARLATRPEAAPFLAAFADFLKEFGHRAVREAELSVPRWREDPSFPLQVIATHLAGPGLSDPQLRQTRQSQTRQAATEQVEALLLPPLRPLFRLLLPLAQEAARIRELLRSCVTDTIGIYRRFFLEVGRRLAAQHLLGRAEDIFFLTFEEVEEQLQGAPRCLLARVLERQARHVADEAAPDPPPTFRVHGPRAIPPNGAVEAPATPPGAVVLQGLGCSAGQVEGVVRVLRSPEEGSQLQPGEILVAHLTDVGWTPLFLVAAGLILDLNGPLSHAAVVAREYGLPAVVNTDQATRLLRDGDRVLLDGSAGQVRILERHRPLP